MLITRYFAAAIIALPLCVAQQRGIEPCAQINNLISAGATLPASVAEACLRSVPLNKQDALQIIDGMNGLLQWQSTVGWLKNPPADYPYPPVDLFKELSNLRSQVASGTLTSEIFFERNLTAIIHKARDGHFYYRLDGMNVFRFVNGFGGVSVVSLDGRQAPALYLQSEVELFVSGKGKAPSAITFINGKAAADWIAAESQNGTYVWYQDGDASFNYYMYQSINNGGEPTAGAFEGLFGVYQGDSMTLRFADGSTLTKNNTATFTGNFSGVFDGPSFAHKFCNATAKGLGLKTGVTSKRQMHPKDLVGRATNADITQLTNYPAPVFISPDGSISGYSLSGTGFDDIAVLVMTGFPLTYQQTPVFQTILTQFMNYCRSQKKKRLIIDITNNSGGAVALVYEVFKQLFPNLEAFNAGNYRSHDGLLVLGGLVASNTKAVATRQPGNETAYYLAGGYSIFDVPVFLRDNGQKYGEFSQMCPKNPSVTARGDTFTNLFRWDLNNPSYTLANNNITVSGYNGKSVGPQPFESQNIVIVGDGQCQSSCTTLSHLLKWQGKVKSIAIGGRPQTGPMQSQGGVKGTQVESLGQLGKLFANSLTQQQVASAFNTTSGPLMQYATTMFMRGASADLYGDDINFNLKNNVAEGDSTFTPLQFVYEAADCRLWNRALWTVSPGSKWYTVAQQAFGVNGTTAWSGCVTGSTNHPSSLSGNAKLYNNGVPNNVTVFVQGNNPQNNSQDSSQNAGGKQTSPTVLTFVIAAVVAAMAVPL